MMWAAIFLIFIIFTIFALVYLWNHIARFQIIQRLCGDSKWRKRLLCAIPFAGIIAYIVTDAIPAIISITHLVLIWLIVECVAKRIGKKAKSQKVYWQGAIAISITTVYLTIAWFIAVTVVPAYYEIETDKLENGESFRIVMFADSHIGSTFDGEKLAQYIHEMEELNPDILVIVGDYVDDDSNKKDMLAATKALGEIDTTYGVYYVFGNHDKGYYNGRDFSEADLREALLNAGVRILEDDVVRINEGVTLVGRQDRSEVNRAPIANLMMYVDKETFSIVLNHQPNDQKAEHDAGVDMVLSGHTHGGQMLPINYLGEWTGLNDQTKGIKVIDQISYIVTSGISDWAIPFKTGCQSEYVVITLEGKN